MTTARTRKSATARKGAATRARRADPLVKAEEQARIVRLWVAGARVDEIAETMNLSRETVYRVRREALVTSVKERDTAVAELREVELQRLDRLQRAHWTRALDGNVGSSRIVLKCVSERAKLVGLYAPIKVDARVRDELDAQIESLVEELEAQGLAQLPE